MKLMVLGKLKFDGDMKKADLLMPLFDEKTLVNTFSQAVPAGKPSHPHARAFQQGPAMEALPSDGLTEATGGAQPIESHTISTASRPRETEIQRLFSAW